MRMARKNMQKMYYALLLGEQEVPVRDDEGNIIIDYTDEEGNEYPRTEMRITYSDPVEFFGNITLSGGESEAVEFGLNMGDYSAVLLTAKGLLPIDETSRIWRSTEPTKNEYGTTDEFSADYTVVKCSPSLNVDKYVLKAVVK